MGSGQGLRPPTQRTLADSTSHTAHSPSARPCASPGSQEQARRGTCWPCLLCTSAPDPSDPGPDMAPREWRGARSPSQADAPPGSEQVAQKTQPLHWVQEANGSMGPAVPPGPTVCSATVATPSTEVCPSALSHHSGTGRTVHGQVTRWPKACAHILHGRAFRAFHGCFDTSNCLL